MRVPFFVALLTAADQLTKYWAVTRLKPVGSVAVVPGFFSLTYVENQGAAWGMLAGRHLFLIGFSLLTLAFLFWRRRQLFDPLWGGRLTLTLLMGGILGNLIDRVHQNGLVTDFLNLGIGPVRTGIFNVADVALTVGAVALLITYRRVQATQQQTR